MTNPFGPLDPLAALQVGLWFLAGAVALYFSVGSARIWTSISTGFFLLFVSQAYLLAPVAGNLRLEALHAILGTISIMVLTFGFQEYYVFSRTLEAGGGKAVVPLVTAGVVLASVAFLYANPVPTPAVVRHVTIVENANWTFLALINLDMIRKIWLQVRDSEISRGFLAFGAVFVLLFLWKGSELYLQVYGWDPAFSRVVGRAAGAVAAPGDALRVPLSTLVHEGAATLSAVAVGGTFAYLFRLLR